MFRVISKIAVSGAVLILMVHALFPHSHEDEPGCAPEVQEDAIIHLLTHVFEQDLGTNHLETYLKVSQASIKGPVSEMLTNVILNSDIIAISDRDLPQNIYFITYRPIEPLSSGPPRSPPTA